MAQVSMDFKGKSVSEKITAVRTIIDKLEDNVNFPTPKPTIKQLSDATDALETAYVAAQDGGKTDKLRQDKAEAELDRLISILAAHLQSESEGDEEKLKSAGVGIKKDASAIGVPVAPTNVLAKVSTIEGSVELKWKPVTGAKSYIVQVSSDLAGSSWSIHDVCTAAKVTASGFESGKKYLFRIIAVGAAGKSPGSDPAVGMAG